jgi:hypothetical protein
METATTNSDIPQLPAPKKGRAFRRFLWRFLLFSILIIAAMVYWFYYNSKSDGTRVGKLFKFSRKGDIFKTFEGEILLPGSRLGSGGFQNNFFYFSVTNDSIARMLEKSQGKEIEVHYIQYRKNLPWRGENNDSKNQESGQYIVDKVTAIREASGY